MIINKPKIKKKKPIYSEVKYLNIFEVPILQPNIILPSLLVFKEK